MSTKVSPLVTEDCEAEKLITSAERRFSANSNDRRVRVLFSKKRLAIVISRSEGTFFIGRLMTSLKWSAVSKINCISFSVIYLIPNRWFTLNALILYSFLSGCAKVIIISQLTTIFYSTALTTPTTLTTPTSLQNKKCDVHNMKHRTLSIVNNQLIIPLH